MASQPPATPEYIGQIQRAMPDKTEAQIELLVSTSRQLREITGLSAHEHRKRGMAKLFPSRSWHYWREQRTESVQFCIENHVQELGWMGSASSGKSQDMADLALTLYWSNPRVTTIYVASPYKDATEKGIWAKIVESFYEAQELNPRLEGVMKHATKSIVLDEKAHPRSFISLVTVDEVGKLKGKKSIDPNSGLIVLMIDEFPDFTSNAAENLIKSLENLKANRNLLVISAGNFTSISDGFATLTSPRETDIPNGWDGFDPDRHFRWRTDRGGLALRFDGLQSPNVLHGSDIYPYLTRIDFIAEKAAAPGGLKSAAAMREIRSAPVTSMDEFTVTNHERIRASGTNDSFEWTGDAVLLGAFCDFGLGGDDCVIQKFKLGWTLQDGKKLQVMALWEAPFVMAVTLGEGLPVFEQLGYGLKDYCQKYGIPQAHVGYDAAMRAGLTQQVATVYGLEAKSIDSNGPATDRLVSIADKRPWREVVDRLVSEFWFSTASLIDSRQLKGLGLSPKAVEQLCTRRWERRGKKNCIQTKAEYKALLRALGRAAESPNEADAVVGCVEMARRMGLTMAGYASNGGALQMVLRMIQERSGKVGQFGQPQGSGLPSAGLHAMKRTPGRVSGVLNRRR